MINDDQGEVQERRAILSSWASDALRVGSMPTLRQPPDAEQRHRDLALHPGLQSEIILIFLRLDQIDESSDVCAWKWSAFIHQRLLGVQPSECLPEFAQRRPGCYYLCHQRIVDGSENGDDVATCYSHGSLPDSDHQLEAVGALAKSSCQVGKITSASPERSIAETAGDAKMLFLPLDAGKYDTQILVVGRHDGAGNVRERQLLGAPSYIRPGAKRNATSSSDLLLKPGRLQNT